MYVALICLPICVIRLSTQGGEARLVVAFVWTIQYIYIYMYVYTDVYTVANGFSFKFV